MIREDEQPMKYQKVTERSLNGVLNSIMDAELEKERIQRRRDKDENRKKYHLLDPINDDVDMALLIRAKAEREKAADNDKASTAMFALAVIVILSYFIYTIL